MEGGREVMKTIWDFTWALVYLDIITKDKGTELDHMLMQLYQGKNKL